MTSGLTEALKAAFPVVRKLVGGVFSTAMAGIFVRQHPPRSFIIMMHDAGFIDFLTVSNSSPPIPTQPKWPASIRLCAKVITRAMRAMRAPYRRPYSPYPMRSCSRRGCHLPRQCGLSERGGPCMRSGMPTLTVARPLYPSRGCADHAAGT